jgi:hypothetical protein
MSLWDFRRSIEDSVPIWLILVIALVGFATVLVLPYVLDWYASTSEKPSITRLDL